ncbi:MAG TPA: DUF5719 family protein [Acidimicrobiia bacterium]|nr:DUF5719 family protein [Acidimicrobiia bacterium]
MTRIRLLVIIAVVAILSGGVFLSNPAESTGEELPPAGDGPYLVCPGALAGGGFQARLGVYNDEALPIRITAVGVPEATAVLEPVGLGGATFNIGDLAELGTTPVYLDGPGNLVAATFSGTPQASTLSSCIRAESVPTALLGMATTGDEGSTLQFVNPFAQDASIRLEIVSELGADTPSDLEAIRIPAGTHVEVPLTRVLSGREAMSVQIQTVSGMVAAASVRTGDTDLAVNEARPGALEWHFPLFGGALGGEIHLRSVGDLIGDYRIDRIDQTGTVEGVSEGAINPGEQVVLPASELMTDRGGLRVAATEPVVAGLVLQTGNIRSVMHGGSIGSRWVVPVSATAGDGQTMVWILNMGAGPGTVALTALGGEPEILPVELPPGAIAEVPLPDLGGGGVLVESGQQIVVAFGVVQGEAIGISMATVIG